MSAASESLNVPTINKGQLKVVGSVAAAILLPGMIVGRIAQMLVVLPPALGPIGGFLGFAVGS